MTGTDSPRRVAVVGAGIVGRRAGRLLGPDAIVVPSASEVPTDGSVVVVLATGVPHAPDAARLVARGVSVVSVSDDVDDVRALLDLDDSARGAGATLVVGAAMSPGLSGLMVRHLTGQLASHDELHVAVHATAGPACARQHHRSLAGHAFGWHDGAWIGRPAGSGRELCWFPEPVGARDCYRAALADPLVLHRADPDVVRISARVSATRRDRLTSRLPMLRPPHPEGGVGALRVEVRGTDHGGGRVTLVSGIAEFVGAAAAATAAACAEGVRRGTMPVGVVTTADRDLDSRGLLDAVVAHGVRLQEFTGVPQIG